VVGFVVVVAGRVAVGLRVVAFVDFNVVVVDFGVVTGLREVVVDFVVVVFGVVVVVGTTVVRLTVVVVF
jgi:hypothetical protein